MVRVIIFEIQCNDTRAGLYTRLYKIHISNALHGIHNLMYRALVLLRLEQAPA